eukprot:44956-Prorocentrum_minimum.AAC.2
MCGVSKCAECGVGRLVVHCAVAHHRGTLTLTTGVPWRRGGARQLARRVILREYVDRCRAADRSRAATSVTPDELDLSCVAASSAPEELDLLCVATSAPHDGLELLEAALAAYAELCGDDDDPAHPLEAHPGDPAHPRRAHPGDPEADSELLRVLWVLAGGVAGLHPGGDGLEEEEDGDDGVRGREWWVGSTAQCWAALAMRRRRVNPPFLALNPPPSALNPPLHLFSQLAPGP